MKIIHLSDLHIGFEDLDEKFELITENLISRISSPEAHVIVVTGDIVEDATDPRGYDPALRHIDKLREAGFHILVAPGNHDYGTGGIGSKKFVPLFRETFFNDPEVRFPKCDIIGKTAFIGLDSMADELHWYDSLFAQGELGKAQLQSLDILLGDSAVGACASRVVYLHHHPFDPWPLHELKDSKELGEILLARGNVEAVLYGHNHEGKKHNGTWNIPRCYDAGSSTRKKNMPSVHRIIDLDADPDEDLETDFEEQAEEPL